MAIKRKTTRITPKNDQAAKTAAAISTVISQIQKSQGLKSDDGKMNINIHIGDIILIGFDEAIDAEEWGMRENNTEIIGAHSSRSKPQNRADSNAAADENRKTMRSIKFKKGALELNALENSEPAERKPSPKRPTKNIVRKTSKKYLAKKATKKVTAKLPPKKRATRR